MEDLFQNQEALDICAEIKSDPNLPDYGKFITRAKFKDGLERARLRRGDAAEAYLVGRRKLQQLLDETKCDGIRIYHFDNETDNGIFYRVAIVPVNAEGDDIFQPIDQGLVEGDCHLIADLRPCPRQCSTTQP